MRLLAWRFMKARKLRALVSGVSVALGVGLLAALLTLNLSTQNALDAHLNKTFGTYDMTVGYRKPDTRLSDADLAEIGRTPGVRDVAGILIPYMSESNSELRPDLSYYGPPDTPLGRQFMPLESGAFPGPAEAAVSAAYATREGWKVGDTVRLPFPPGGQREVRISGLIDATAPGSAGSALFERGWLEMATGRPGGTFVLLHTAPGIDQLGLVFRLQERFPELEYDLRKDRNELRKNMNALRPVALGMGITALLAAVFLLTASFRMALAERTRELALLRAVGATPRQVRSLILTEGALIGLAGSFAGAALGVGGAMLTAGGAARLLSVAPVPTAVPWAGVTAAVFAGFLLALISALGVARAAGRSEPLRAMRPDLPAEDEEQRRGGLFGLLLAAMGAAAVAATPMVSTLPMDGGLKALIGSTGALAIALGLLLGVQRLLPLLLPILASPVRHLAEGPLAVRSLLRHRRRSGLAVGAMGLGLILVLSLSTLATSMVGRQYDALRKERPADVHLEVPSLAGQGVTPDLAEKVAALPGATVVGTVGDPSRLILTNYDWSRATPKFLADMAALDKQYTPGPGLSEREIFSVSPGDLPALLQIGSYRLLSGSVDGWGAAGDLAVSKRQADSLGLKLGDRIRLNVRDAVPIKAVADPDIREFTVTAIVESDSWRMPTALVAEPFPGAPERLNMIYANFAPEQRTAARQQIRALIGSMEYNLVTYSDVETATAELRAQTDQRLALLLAVGVIMAAVAGMSLVNTVVSNVNERKREFALLRAVGATPDQVRRVVLIEAGLLGLVGGVVGVAGGAVLGTGALVGLDMPLVDVRLPWTVMAGGLAVSLLLALAAASGPAARIMRTPPAEAVRQSA